MIPTTCQEAAARFREWARKASTREEVKALNARAEILEAFKGTPLPQAIVDTWDFAR